MVDITEVPEGESFLTGEIALKDVDFVDEEVALKSPVRAELRLQRLGLNLLVDGQVSVLAEMTCGRCTERYRVILQEAMLIQYAPASSVKQNEEEEGEVELVVPYQGKIVDLSDDVRQTVVLSVPVKRICRPDCKGLCPICGLIIDKGGAGAPSMQESGGLLPQGGCKGHGSSKS